METRFEIVEGKTPYKQLVVTFLTWGLFLRRYPKKTYIGLKIDDKVRESLLQKYNSQFNPKRELESLIPIIKEKVDYELSKEEIKEISDEFKKSTKPDTGSVVQ